MKKRHLSFLLFFFILLASISAYAGSELRDAALNLAVHSSVDNQLLQNVFPGGNGHIYWCADDISGKTWTEAESYCESMGGHLVTITSKEEQAFVSKIISAGEKPRNLYWIGGSYDKGLKAWKWVTGEELTYSNWGNAKPDQYHGHDEYYLQMYRVSWKKNPAFSWNDASNAGADYADTFYNLKNTGFVCEWDDMAELPPDLQAEYMKLENIVENITAGISPASAETGKLVQDEPAIVDGESLSRPLAENHDWVSTYRKFVEGGYLQSGQTFKSSKSKLGKQYQPAFALFDMTGDGLPELLAYNGEVYPSAKIYVYSMQDGELQLKDTIKSGTDDLFVSEDSTSIYYNQGRAGGSDGYYFVLIFTLSNGNIQTDWKEILLDGSSTDKLAKGLGLTELHPLVFVDADGLSWNAFVSGFGYGQDETSSAKAPAFVTFEPCDFVDPSSKPTSTSQEGKIYDQTTYPINAGMTIDIPFSTDRNALKATVKLRALKGTDWDEYIIDGREISASTTEFDINGDKKLGALKLTLPASISNGAYMLELFVKNSTSDDQGEWISARARIFINSSVIRDTKVILQNEYNDPEKDMYYKPGKTIKSSGCGICAIVNAVSYLGQNAPDLHEVAQYAMDNHEYKSGIGTSKTLYENYARDCGEQYGFQYVGELPGDDYSGLQSYLRKGCVAIVGVTSKDSSGKELGGHIIVIAGYNTETQKYLILDSAGDYHCWTSKTASGQCAWQSIQDGRFEQNKDCRISSSVSFRIYGVRDQEY